MSPRIHNITPSQQYEDARQHAITAVCMRCGALVSLVPWPNDKGDTTIEIDAYSFGCYHAGHRLVDFTLDLGYHQREEQQIIEDLLIMAVVTKLIELKGRDH